MGVIVSYPDRALETIKVKTDLAKDNYKDVERSEVDA